MTRFIKLIDSEKSRWLQKKHPWAFLLLLTIARRARIKPNLPDGFEIGECHIGDFEESGIPTRKTYRHALDILMEIGAIKKVESCRNRKKGAIKGATYGTKVSLLDSEFYDLNIEEEGHRLGHRGATEGPPKGHEQERIKKEKKEEEEKKIYKEKFRELEKKKIRDWVLLTEKEHASLIQIHGLTLVNLMLDILDSYNTSRQKHYASDYGSLKTNGWVHKEALKRNSKTILFPSHHVDRRTVDVNGKAIPSPIDGRF